MIKFGSIEYFQLISLRDKLKYIGYNNLDLQNLDKLRMELEIKIGQIDHQYEVNKKLEEREGE